MRVLLDTNFLIDILRFKIDLKCVSDLVLEPYKFFTLESVLKELELISKKKSVESGYAKIALQIIENEKIKIVKSDESVDKAILDLKDSDIIVATNDMRLRKLLKARRTKTIYIKSKKYLGIG
jgi:rRNA-processing protein FCF1